MAGAGYKFMFRLACDGQVEATNWEPTCLVKNAHAMALRRPRQLVRDRAAQILAVCFGHFSYFLPQLFRYAL